MPPPIHRGRPEEVVVEVGVVEKEIPISGFVWPQPQTPSFHLAPKEFPQQFPLNAA
jgi:hypothetical protein